MMQAFEEGRTLLKSESQSIENKRSALYSVFKAVVNHVNLVESSIAQDALSGASLNPAWNTYRAETALELLKQYPSIHDFFEVWCSNLKLDSGGFQLGKTAMASTQRIAIQNFPDEANTLQSLYSSKGLPTRGFDAPIPVTSTEKNASIEYEPGGSLKSITGIRSEDAVEIAKNVVNKGESGYTAPATSSPAKDLINSTEPTEPAEPSAKQRFFGLSRNLTIGIVGSVIATLIVTLLIRAQCWPSETQEPSVNTTLVNEGKKTPSHQKTNREGNNPEGELGEARNRITEENQRQGKESTASSSHILPADKLVFATSIWVNGELGYRGAHIEDIDGLRGIRRADTICQSLANSSNLIDVLSKNKRQFKAWLSQNETDSSPSARFNKSDHPYVLVSKDKRIQISRDWGDLTDGALQHPISLNEYGAPVLPPPERDWASMPAWTGTTPKGTPTKHNCQEWTSARTRDGGTHGSLGATNEQWTQGATNCNDYFPLYCFEQ